MVTLASSPEAKRLQCLIRHIEGVRQDCQLLGTRLIERGEDSLGRTLIANGFMHDHSKFSGIEWDHLYSRDDPLFGEAWKHHIYSNDHHPEFWEPWGGICAMERVAVAEMCCDWHSRSAEFGSCLRQWIDEVAMKKYHFGPDDEVGKHISDFVDLLLEHWA